MLRAARALKRLAGQVTGFYEAYSRPPQVSLSFDTLNTDSWQTWSYYYYVFKFYFSQLPIPLATPNTDWQAHLNERTLTHMKTFRHSVKLSVIYTRMPI